MSFQEDPEAITWRLSLRSDPESVFELLATDRGRSLFWAESAPEIDGIIRFIFPNGFHWDAEIIEQLPPERFVVNYIDDCPAVFELGQRRTGGTILKLTNSGVPEHERSEVIAGWVSVLLALKAQADFGVDLRNHDPEKSWDQSYVEN